MLAQPAVQDHHLFPVVTIPRMFLAEEIAWLSNEARVLRAFSGHQVWIDDPDLRADPFRRLAYHPRLSAAVAKLTSAEVAVESTTLLYARRGIVSPSAPYWQPAGEGAAAGSLAVVFLGEAGISVAGDVEDGFGRVDGAAGDVVVFPSKRSRLTATTDGYLAPLLLVQFGNGSVGRCNDRSVIVPKLGDDCLWQPAYWTAG